MISNIHIKKDQLLNFACLINDDKSVMYRRPQNKISQKKKSFFLLCISLVRTERIFRMCTSAYASFFAQLKSTEWDESIVLNLAVFPVYTSPNDTCMCICEAADSWSAQTHTLYNLYLLRFDSTLTHGTQRRAEDLKLFLESNASNSYQYRRNIRWETVVSVSEAHANSLKTG